MDTKDLDIVYFVKDAPSNEELRYSLRSMCANMPHKRVWIFGGRPANIEADIHVKVNQEGKTKWDKVRSMFEMACLNKELTDDFILFNDDFFIMQPTDKIEPLYRGSLADHIKVIEDACWHKPSDYTRQLRRMNEHLESMGLSTLSYELHIPFIFNKKQLLYLINKYPDMRCTRTFYGNFYNVGGKQHRDVKIFSDKPSFDYKTSRFLSTDDSVVNVNNNAWRYIRKQFPKKCEYER